LKTSDKKGPKINNNMQFFESTGKNIYGKSSASSIENIPEVTMSITQDENNGGRTV
jgi:hypothetical protein